jgi:hypothetical protein
MRACRAAVVLSALLFAVCAAPISAQVNGASMQSPAAGQSLAPGSVVEVRWGSLCAAGMKADEAELVLSVDGGATFPIRVSHELSPCETRYLWRVPVLATGRARLGVRTGHEGFGETERIALVGGEFRILSDLDGRVQQLYRRVAEWWTPEPAILTAQDLLDRTMSPERGHLSRSDDSADAAAPPETPVFGPALATAAFTVASTPRAMPIAPVVSRSSSAPTPLRL